MFFLLRVAFWLCVVFVLLPTGGADKDKSAQAAAPQINPVEAVSAASATVSDMRHFCERQAEACAVGSQAAAVLGQRAQAGAKMVYEFINEKIAASETGAVSTKPAVHAATANQGKASQNTLTPTDLAPAWRGPQPIREARRPT
jgi:hypothetical protein